MHRDEKDGEMYSSGVRPNHDGTYQMEKRTEYDTESAKYSCKVDHSGLTEPMILFYEPKADSMVPVIVGVVIAVLVLIALAIVGVVIYKKKAGKKTGYNPAKTSDKGDSSSNSSTNATA
ncbi:class I histocompatibility antigen, F10 alpha chain-like [Scyliorhinus torazame]|uniref:class I histocompatibility antigen, F10 alpha chain-like n=1 Tax=Scyliorhinus torazame TaxID=75743 RepID=UPI003B5B8F76